MSDEATFSLFRALAERASLCLRAVAVAAGLLALLAGCASLSVSSAGKEAQAQRLGDSFVQALPVDRMLAKVMHDAPQWPLNSASSNSVTLETLACVRTEMSPDKLTAQQRADARRYAEDYSTRIADDIRLLELGAAGAIGKIIMSAAKEGIGSQADATQTRRRAVKATINSVPPGQAIAMTQLILSPAHDDLREAMRLNFITEALNSDRSDVRRKGMQLGESLIAPLLLSAVQTCDVSFSALK